jgi:hypothetical protein
MDTNNPTGYAQVLDERTAAGVLTVAYSYGLDLLSEREAGTGATHFYGYDALGSTRLLADATGAVTDTYTLRSLRQRTLPHRHHPQPLPLHRRTGWTIPWACSTCGRDHCRCNRGDLLRLILLKHCEYKSATNGNSDPINCQHGNSWELK